MDVNANRANQSTDFIQYANRQIQWSSWTNLDVGVYKITVTASLEAENTVPAIMDFSLTVLAYVNSNSPYLTRGDVYNSTIQNLSELKQGYLDLGLTRDDDGD